jgi:hypothetical protein
VPASGAFLGALALLDWTIGRNVWIDAHWTTPGDAEISKHAAELAALAPDVIFRLRTFGRGGVVAGDPRRADRVRGHC